jgi:hypothetical protein
MSFLFRLSSSLSHPYFNTAVLPLGAGNGSGNGATNGPHGGGGGGGGGEVTAKLEDLQAAAQAAAMAAGHQRAASLQWPGIQGLLSNPNFWRDRFNGKMILLRAGKYVQLNFATINVW